MIDPSIPLYLVDMKSYHVFGYGRFWLFSVVKGTTNEGAVRWFIFWPRSGKFTFLHMFDND